MKDLAFDVIELGAASDETKGIPELPNQELQGGRFPVESLTE